MKLLKSKQQPQRTPIAGSSLADRIRQARREAEAFVESKVRELKASEEGSGLPIDWLRQNLKARNGGNCSCRVALSLLAGDTNATPVKYGTVADE